METIAIAIDRRIGQITWAAIHLTGDLHIMVSIRFINMFCLIAFASIRIESFIP